MLHSYLDSAIFRWWQLAEMAEGNRPEPVDHGEPGKWWPSSSATKLLRTISYWPDDAEIEIYGYEDGEGYLSYVGSSHREWL